MTMLKQDSRPMSSTSYAGNDLRLRNNNPNPRSRTSVDTPPSSPNQSAERSLRICCFSCCLSRNPAPARDRKPVDHSYNKPQTGQDDVPITSEDVRLWGESFDNVMNSVSGRRVFRDFLKCEYSEENILFWLACEDLKKETNPETVEEKARIIYEDYISILSPKEVSLDARVREIINRNMVEPSRSTFDEAQLQIFTLMHRDSYPRFVNSPQYRALMDKYLKPTPGGGPALIPVVPPSVGGVTGRPNNSGASVGSAPQSSSSNSHIRTSLS